MKKGGHGTSGVCPATAQKGEIVQLYGASNHLLLQLKGVLPCERLFE